MKTRAESCGKSGDYSVENGGKSGRGIKVHLTLLNVVLTNQAWAKRDFDPFLSFLNFAIFFSKKWTCFARLPVFLFLSIIQNSCFVFLVLDGIEEVLYTGFFFFWWTICFNYNRECLEKSKRRISLKNGWKKCWINVSNFFGIIRAIISKFI